MPDEYLPPNNVLFVQNLPEGTTSDDLREVFEVCVILSFSNNLYQRPSFPSQKHVTPLLSPLPVPAGRLCPYCTGFLRRVRAHNIAAEDSTAMRDRTEHANNPNSRHAGLVEIRTIPAKKDIAFVEFADEATATVAKDALHNFKIDGETKMKVSLFGPGQNGN